MVDATHVGIFALATVLYTIVAIITSYLFYSVIKSIFGKPKPNAHRSSSVPPQQTTITTTPNGHKLMIGCNTCGLFSFVIHTIVSVLLLWIVLLSSDYTDQTINAIFGGFWVFYLIGLWTMLFIFVSRIDNTFKNSFLAYPPFVIKILYGWTFIIAILMVIAAAFNAMQLHGVLNEILGPILLLMHFLFSMVLMYLLCRKVFVAIQLRMIQRIENTNKQMIDVEENGDESVSNKGNVVDLMSIKSLTQYMLLVIIGIISSYIGNIMVLALPPPSDGVFHGRYSVIYAFDIIVNAFALYFLFGFNGRVYYKMCGCCHRLCEKCCIECAFKFVDKEKLSDKTKEQCANLILTE